MSLGRHVRKSLDKKAKKYNHNILNTVDSFYVLYVLFTGVIDDISEALRVLYNEDWNKLPI